MSFQFNPAARDESIAYALAAGLAIVDDQDGEKLARRQRFARRRSHKGAR